MMIRPGSALLFLCFACMLFLIFGFASPTIESLLTKQPLEVIVSRWGPWLAIQGAVALFACVVGLVWIPRSRRSADRRQREKHVRQKEERNQ